MWVTHLLSLGFSGDRCLEKETVSAVLSHTWPHGTQAGLRAEMPLILEPAQMLSNISCPLVHLTDGETETQGDGVIES